MLWLFWIGAILAALNILFALGTEGYTTGEGFGYGLAVLSGWIVIITIMIAAALGVLIVVAAISRAKNGGG